jgi:Na+/H+-dicarboxylate symporter
MSEHDAAESACSSAEPKPARRRWPLYLRVLIGAAIGTMIGLVFKKAPIGFGEFHLSATTADLGTIANLYIQTLTALATPLIFFAILDAFVQTQMTAQQGLKMFAICLMNIAVAFAIGLAILNIWQPGKAWSDSFETRAKTVSVDTKRLDEVRKTAETRSLSPLEMLKGYVPKNILQPFSENIVLTVAMMAILVGMAMRSLMQSPDPATARAISLFAQFVVACYQMLLKMLLWIIDLAPYAICLAIAAAVGELGPGVFRILAVFVVTVVASLGIHSLIYYPLSAWLLGGKSPRVYFGEGASAILTGLSINSSLATAPLTLEALRRMGVSEASARLSACVGTNFNNDGITLYEAITVLFVAQAAGMNFSLLQQMAVLMAALAGSMGIAGIPSSGLIILALVFKAANMPDDVVQLAFPLVYSVDVIHGRLRSAVNVMGDLQVAILLDAGRQDPAPMDA